MYMWLHSCSRYGLPVLLYKIRGALSLRGAVNHMLWYRVHVLKEWIPGCAAYTHIHVHNCGTGTCTCTFTAFRQPVEAATWSRVFPFIHLCIIIHTYMYMYVQYIMGGEHTEIYMYIHVYTLHMCTYMYVHLLEVT